MNGLHDVLSVFWSEYKVWIWSKEMPFSSFIGRELLEFIQNADKIVAFLQLHLAKTEKLTDLCDALTI